MSKTPLVILSDDPSANSGLARITRDLASRIHEHLGDAFEVATIGYGGAGSKRFPWMSYHLHSIENWLPVELPDVWKDFVGDRNGIFMGIWDASRFWWINNPQAPPHLRQWLKSDGIKKWIYHPVDAAGPGPNGEISKILSATLECFDRVLDYSAFSCTTTGSKHHLPHGIDRSVFKKYDHLASKRKFRELG
ncbi:MAG: hypothetical protein KGL39_30450, partial [Patescibacteria group bacterium]|nr:hypothetical protein [Patescibacteria group bacterium]